MPTTVLLALGLLFAHVLSAAGRHLSNTTLATLLLPLLVGVAMGFLLANSKNRPP